MIGGSAISEHPAPKAHAISISKKIAGAKKLPVIVVRKFGYERQK